MFDKESQIQRYQLILLAAIENLEADTAELNDKIADGEIIQCSVESIVSAELIYQKLLREAKPNLEILGLIELNKAIAEVTNGFELIKSRNLPKRLLKVNIWKNIA